MQVNTAAVTPPTVLNEMISPEAKASAAQPRVAFVQDGARLHYALPAALQRAGALERVYVDWFVRSGSLEEKAVRGVQKILPGLGRRLAERRCDELSADRVVASPFLALRIRLILQGSDAPERKFARISEILARHVQRRGWGNANALMGFVRNIDPKLCEAARQAGFTVVADQMIASAIIQWAEEQRQASRWPGWPPGSEFVDVDFVRAREARTWAATHHVTCPSDYVRDGLLQAHVPADKISVIPYPIDAQGFSFVDRRGRLGPPMIGFVGSVTVRKGAPAFVKVAQRFNPNQARFVMVGPIATDIAQKMRQAPSVELIGPVSRGQVPHWLEQFDVFFFPSTCEGSAGAVMEAMATGLPVVTTPNSGSVIRNGVEGFIVPCGDVDAFEGCLSRLIADPAYRVHLGRAARRRASSFDLDWYSRQLGALFDRLQKTQMGTCNQGLN